MTKIFKTPAIILCAALALTVGFASVAAAQTSTRAPVKPYSEFEKTWFQIPNPPGS